jgi:hypothetical protein
MIRVKKFSWNKEDRQASVTYTIDRGKDGSEKHSLECSDAPKPELLEALQALAVPALKECEVVRVMEVDLFSGLDRLLGPGKTQEYKDMMSRIGSKKAEAVVRSVSYSWSLDIMGASICLLVALDHADQPLVLNTPHKPSQPYSGEVGHTLPEGLADDLQALHVLIERYIDGDRVRQQTDLFDDEPAATPAEEGAVSLNGSHFVPLNTFRKLLDGKRKGA